VLHAVPCRAVLCCAVLTASSSVISCCAGGSDQDVQDAAAAQGDLQPFTQSPESAVSLRTGSRTRRLLSLFNMRSSSGSITEPANSTLGQPPLLHLRFSSTYAVGATSRDGGGAGSDERRTAFGGPGSSLLSGFSILTSRTHSPRKVPSSKQGRLHHSTTSDGLHSCAYNPPWLVGDGADADTTVFGCHVVSQHNAADISATCI
jgi:hypothetical protein